MPDSHVCIVLLPQFRNVTYLDLTGEGSLDIGQLDLLFPSLSALDVSENVIVCDDNLHGCAHTFGHVSTLTSTHASKRMTFAPKRMTFAPKRMTFAPKRMTFMIVIQLERMLHLRSLRVHQSVRPLSLRQTNRCCFMTCTARANVWRSWSAIVRARMPSLELQWLPCEWTIASTPVHGYPICCHARILSRRANDATDTRSPRSPTYRRAIKCGTLASQCLTAETSVPMHINP
jgi:hypothetical protein